MQEIFRLYRKHWQNRNLLRADNIRPYDWNGELPQQNMLCALGKQQMYQKEKTNFVANDCGVHT